ncbi:MAG: Txe/YoeB family addiction module toxin [Firmicutes bacterium]|nr:Txe/YoeB family addiction module toxin [Bacillota bacterium]
MNYRIVFLNSAEKDLKQIKKDKQVTKKFNALIEVLRENPYQPPFKKLEGEWVGFYSRRINLYHRLIYGVDECTKTVKIMSAWGRY